MKQAVMQSRAVTITQKSNTQVVKRPETITNTRKAGEPFDKMKMKTMTITLLLLGYAGLLAEVSDVFPSIPNSITFPLIVTALGYAIWQMWKQGNNERREYKTRLAEMQKEHRQEVMEMHDRIMEMVRENQQAIQEILREMNSKK